MNMLKNFKDYLNRFLDGKSGRLIKWVLVLLTIVVIYFLWAGKNEDIEFKDYSALMRNIENNHVKRIVLYDGELTKVMFTDGKEFMVKIPDKAEFIRSIDEKLKKGALEVEYKSSLVNFGNIVSLLSTLVCICLLLSIQKREFRLGKINISAQKSDITFDDVAGLEEEKEELAEIVEFLREPAKYTKMGARIPKGVLLVGPSGTGKTLLAKAVAGEAGVPFYSVSGSEFVEIYVGVGPARIRKLFNQAKKTSPSIIFIDEIDAVGSRSTVNGNTEDNKTINQLLIEMDGFSSTQIIVIAATNRPEDIDPALRRPNRIDRVVPVGRPDIKAREEILILHSRGKHMENVNLHALAQDTPGFTGADLENMLNEAAIISVNKGNAEITMQDISEARIKVTVGKEKKTRVISEAEKKLVAYHEAGHAVVSRFLFAAQCVVDQISIIPTGLSGGYTSYKAEEESSYLSRREMFEQMVKLMGGRAAEEIVLGDASTGAQDDINKANALARDMILKYGMSEKLGPIVLLDNNDGSCHKEISESLSAEIDYDIKKVVTDSHEKAKSILEENLGKVHKLAQALIEKEKLQREEIEKLLA